MKKIIPPFHSRLVFLSLIVLLFSCAKPKPVPEAGSSLTIHYYRFDGNYAGWNAWVWPADPPGGGKSCEFGSPDEDGFVTARVVLPEKTGEFGMIIRRSEENGDEWAEKDTDSDRFTDPGDVWIVQGDPAVYAEKPETGEPPILFAMADSADTVTVRFLKAPEDFGVFAVYEDDKKLAGSSVRGTTDTQAVIHLNEEISDPAKRITVRDESGVFAEKEVTLRNILNAYYYGGDDLGLRYTPERSFFKVWAPTAKTVSVALYNDPGTYNQAGMVTDNVTENLLSMKRDRNTGVWSTDAAGDLAGKYYLYRVGFASGWVNWAVDPYARAVSANGQRGAVVDPAAANPPGWPGTKPPFAAPSWQDAVIYELHVRDFSIDEDSGMKHKGKFLAFTERGTKNKEGFPTGVDHIVNLGVTHVHLLPSFDFASVNELAVDDPLSPSAKFNWGYDPQNYNVPEGSYSTDPADPLARIREFKQMVQSLHEAGIRVIMDVVYNHTYQVNGSPFDSLVPGYYYRTTETGALSNGSGCGNETASERPMVRKYIIDSCLFWAKEYSIDGFRFDLMGLIDTETMRQLTEKVRNDVDRSIIIYGEPWLAGKSPLPAGERTVTGAQKGLGFAVFNDRLRNAIKGGSDDASRGFATGAPNMEAEILSGIRGSVDGFTACANESINYVTAHDNLNLWDKIASSFGAKDLANAPYNLIENGKPLMEQDAVRASILANGIILTSQGIPFFQAGDEMLRTKFGDHNSYASPDSINRIRWNNAGKYREVIQYYAGLIRLRKEHPAFRMNSKTDMDAVTVLSSRDDVIAFTIDGRVSGDSWRTIYVAYNSDSKPVEVELPKTAAAWNQVVNAEKAGVETLNSAEAAVILPPFSMAVLHD
ncbi:MAG: type I pullulanase [Treponema sp.]|jgi:pullulanase|nr:type I pullulanase [Treponema sp.]